jgi:hypothetical protein
MQIMRLVAGTRVTRLATAKPAEWGVLLSPEAIKMRSTPRRRVRSKIAQVDSSPSRPRCAHLTIRLEPGFGRIGCSWQYRLRYSVERLLKDGVDILGVTTAIA